MVQQAMASPHRLIGMIQPQNNEGYYEMDARVVSQNIQNQMMAAFSSACQAVRVFACHDTQLQTAGYLTAT